METLSLTPFQQATLNDTFMQTNVENEKFSNFVGFFLVLLNQRKLKTNNLM